MAILVDAGGQFLGQVGNIEPMGYLKKAFPRDASQRRIIMISNFHGTTPYPQFVSTHDEEAVFLLRLYRECNGDGVVLDASMNHDGCIENAPHVFNLSIGDSSVEPSTWIPASAILTSVRMCKIHDKARDWEMNAEDDELMPGLFREA